MTLPDSTPRQQYTGNDVAVAFAFPYLFFDEDDVKIYRRVISTDIETLVSSGEYTVTGEGNPLGGTFTFATEPMSDHELTLLREVAFIQDSNYVSNEGFPADAHEQAVDRIVMMCQELREVQARTIKLPRTILDSLGVDVDLKTPVALDGITWDTAGTGLDSAATGAGAVIEAEAARDAAQVAQTAAELAETNAETAQTGAELAETNAEIAQSAAEDAQAAAEAALAALVVDDDSLEHTTDIHIKDDGVKKAHINVDVVRAGNGLAQHTDGSLQVDPSDTAPGLEISDGGVRVKSDESTIERDAGGIRVKDAGIIPVKLKTAQGEVSFAPGGSGHGGYAVMMAGTGDGTKGVTYGTLGTSYTTKISLIVGATEGHVTLPGGEYGFYPQTKSGTPAGAETAFAQQRYVTASGQDHWIFLLIDKLTGDIRAAYSAPDHPMYGNGGDIQEVPHPFIGNDLTGLEIVILGKADVAEVKGKATKKDTILTIIHRDYTVDVTKEEPYEPLHTGQFIDKSPVMVDVLPTGLKVKKLKVK